MNEKKYPEPIVGAFIFNQENKLLLVTSPKWKGKYVVPGGHIELGESMEQALKREVKEETNLNVYDIKLALVQDFIFDESFHKKKHFVFLDHICKTKDSKVILNKEGTSYKWVTIDEALNLPLEPYTKIVISKLKERYLK